MLERKKPRKPGRRQSLLERLSPRMYIGRRPYCSILGGRTGYLSVSRFSATFADMSIAAAGASALTIVESVADVAFASRRLLFSPSRVLDAIWEYDGGVELLELVGIGEQALLSSAHDIPDGDIEVDDPWVS
jgi:hypothetical protein